MKYARIERERRFLLARPPAPLAAEYREITDLYFPQTTLRLRAVRAPDGSPVQWKLGQKQPGPGGPAEQVMTSLYLREAEYALLARLPGRGLRKRRHVHEHAGRAFAIDVFLGALDGLVLAEVNADTDAELRAIPRPAFAQCEVTETALFTGGMLATSDPAQVLRAARELLTRPA